MRCFPCICSNICGCIADVMLLCTLVRTFSAYVLCILCTLWSVVCGPWPVVCNDALLGRHDESRTYTYHPSYSYASIINFISFPSMER